MLKEALFRPSAVDETTGTRIWSYPLQRFDLAAEITRVLLERELIPEPVPLEELHQFVTLDEQKRDENFMSKLSSTFYETLPALQNLYLQFVKYLADDVFGEELLFQRHPSIRFHFPMREGMFSNRSRTRDGELLWHHSDVIYGHPFEEINCWLPLTECVGSNALSMGSLARGRETLADLACQLDYDEVAFHERGHEHLFARLDADVPYRRAVVDDCKPVIISPGSLLCFDPRCIHSTLENRENKTRVSVDFRVVPVRAYRRMDRVYRELYGDVTFTKGSYYHPESTSELTLWEPIASRRRAR